MASRSFLFLMTIRLSFCSTPGCQRKLFCDDLCHKHYDELQQELDPWFGLPNRPPKPCKHKGCPESARWRGYCGKHYRRVMIHGDSSVILQSQRRLYARGQAPKFCVKGDGKPAHARGLCRAHYAESIDWGPAGSKRLDLCPVCEQNKFLVRKGNGMCRHCVKRIVARTRFKHENNHWDRATCLMAGRAWHETTGYAPWSTQWRANGPRSRFPASAIVIRLFGSWRNYIHELGLPQAQKRYNQPVIIYTIDACLQAGLEYVDAYGHIPSRPQWIAAGMTPSHEPIRKRFGSWTAFKTALANLDE